MASEKVYEALVDLLHQQDRRLQLLEHTLKETVSTNPSSVSNSSELIIEALANSIKEFSYDPEDHNTFDKWYNRYEDTFIAAKTQINEDAQIRLLLRKLDHPSHTKYVNYILPRTVKDFNFEETVKKLKAILCPQTSIFNRRFNCLQMKKKDSDDFVTYAGKVNRNIEDFIFSELGVEQFKCLIFISGLQSHKDSDIRARLLRRLDTHTTENPIELHHLVQECQKMIALKQDTALVENKNPVVSKVEYKKHPHPRNNNKQPTATDLPKYPCWKCGGMHFVKSCEFIKHTCTDCKGVGHKEGYCKSGKQNNSQQGYKSNPKAGKGKSVAQTKHVSIPNVHKVNFQHKRKYATVHINGKMTKLQLDTASDITIISSDIWKQIDVPITEHTSFQAKNASGDPLEIIGSFYCDITLNEITKKGKCYVTSIPELNLLGIDWMDLFDLWSQPLNTVCSAVTTDEEVPHEYINILAQQFPDVFSKQLGLCTKTKVKLHVLPRTKPTYISKRPVSYSALPLVDQELKRLEEMNIIEKVEYSLWATPIVVVHKSNGKIRICADYSTGLNTALQPNSHPLPLPEDIFASLTGNKYFSVIDLSEAYFQLAVDEESQELLTINTHRGLYKFKRLPFGVKTAPGVFQNIIDAMIGDLPFVQSYLDDLIIFSKNVTDHKYHLTKIMSRIQQYGFTLQTQKCQLFTSEVKFLGQIISEHGLKPDPNKIDCIRRMPIPTNISELRSFLGAINFYGKFIHKMSQLRGPLDVLLKKNTTWYWTPDQQSAFDKLKEVLQSDLLLTHYDPLLPIIVAADASNQGIGAVIMHELPNKSRKAIFHSSRTLTETEKKYSQIEKEALGLIYAVTKFHKYIFGRHFTLETDHKPLLHIFGNKKGIPIYTANRLQRWACTLLLYDFDITYINTDSFGYADFLSRLIDSQPRSEEDSVIASVYTEIVINSIQTNTVTYLPVLFNEIEQESKNDSNITTVIEYMSSGWPSNKKEISTDLLPFFNRKDELSVVRNTLMLGERVVIPTYS
ncbi:uncharacterized protein K02A2.6-like [Photinus pyralis]|nr:uncharacterized protein K02A2.6-like [Photinus pyralis]